MKITLYQLWIQYRQISGCIFDQTCSLCERMNTIDFQGQVTCQGHNRHGHQTFENIFIKLGHILLCLLSTIEFLGQRLFSKGQGY